MAVPFIDLKRFEPDFLERWHERVRDVTANTRFVGGPDVAKLEARLRDDTGVAEVVTCANGTDAIQLALRAVGVGDGDRVLIPDATFWATFEAVVNVGARPVTVDIDRRDLQMDFDLFASAIAEHRPKAAILVNLYGWGSARLADFRRLCAEKGLPLIEDTAQGYASTWRGESLFKGAFISTTSFYPAKVLGACGDAGAVFCSSKDQAAKVRRLGNHGRTSHYAYGEVGWNSRLGGLEGSWLELCMDYLPARIESRRRAAQWYQAELKKLDVEVVVPPADYVENGYLNVMLVDPEVRPKIEATLKENGIGFGNVYPGSMSTQPGAEGFIAGRVGGAVAEWQARAVLNLPLFAYLKDSELEEVMSVFRKALAAV